MDLLLMIVYVLLIVTIGYIVGYERGFRKIEEIQEKIEEVYKKYIPQTDGLVAKLKVETRNYNISSCTCPHCGERVSDAFIDIPNKPTKDYGQIPVRCPWCKTNFEVYFADKESE